MSEENKSKEEEISKEEILLNELSQYGYANDNLISQSELTLFLDRKSTKNKFDISLLEKLCSLLNLTEYNTVTISQFISGFVKMDEEFRKTREELNEEYLNKKKEYENIIDMCKRYQTEKLNEEGFSENARLSGDIIETIFNVDLDGIEEIILKIMYGEEKQEIKKNTKQKEEDKESNKHLELKASSGKEHLEFKLMTRNYLNYVTEIGSKTYSLEGIKNQDPFFIKVEIPFDDDCVYDKDGSLAAIIKAKISLRWSDLEYYEQQKQNEEPKLKKLISDLEQAEESIKKIDKIYSLAKKSEKNEAENNNKKNNESLNRKILEFPDNNFIVDFNNERIDTVISKGLKVDFNNEKEVEIPCDNKSREKKEEEKNINNNNDNNINLNNLAELNEHNFSYEIMNINENNENNENNEINTDNNEINYEHILNNNDIINQGEQINLQDEVKVIPEQHLTSYNNMVLTESTNKAVIQENTLPLKYLPQKVNKVIYDNTIHTLPLIDGGKKITYANLPESSNVDI